MALCWLSDELIRLCSNTHFEHGCNDLMIHFTVSSLCNVQSIKHFFFLFVELQFTKYRFIMLFDTNFVSLFFAIIFVFFYLFLFWFIVRDAAIPLHSVAVHDVNFWLTMIIDE